MQSGPPILANRQSAIYFLPDIIIQYIIDSQSRKVVLPEKQTFRSLLAYINIPQFAQIGATYLSKSKEGHENFTRYFSMYLDVFQATLGRTGGEILKFINDKLIVVWPPTNNRSEEEISMIFKVALKGTFEFRQALQEAFSKEGLQTRLNICFGYGDISLLHLGGVDSKIEYLVVGPAYFEALDCETAMPDDGCTVITGEAYERVQDMFAGEDTSKYDSQGSQAGVKRRPKFVTVKSFNGGRLPAPKSSPLMFKSQLSPILIDGLKSKIANYTQKEYTEFIQENLENWGSEYRPATVLHVNLSIDPLSLTTEASIAKLHHYIRKIQNHANHFQGMIYRTTVDQKGLTVILAFGLYPRAQQEIAVKAISCAVSVISDLGAGLPGSISCGIASGDLFLGFVGQERRDIFIFGDPVYFSYLLKLAAIREKDAKILTDETTRNWAERQVVFTPYTRESFKGRLAQESLFVVLFGIEDRTVREPFSELRTHLNNTETVLAQRAEKMTKMIGKQDLLQKSVGVVMQFLSKPITCGLTLIAGAMGSGKTLFARNMYLAIKKAATGPQQKWKDGESPLILCSGVLALHQGFKMNGWRRIVREILNRLAKQYQLAHEDTLKKVLSRHEDLLANVALVNDVLNSKREGTSDQASQASREEWYMVKKKEITPFEQRMVVDIVIEIFKCYLGEDTVSESLSKPDGSAVVAPIIIFLDDLQDHDELSWNLLGKMVKTLKKVYIVGLIRVDQFEFLPTEKAQFVQQSIINISTKQANVTKILIEPLTQQESSQLISDAFGVADCDPKTVEVIYQKTRGNPLMTIQLLGCLKNEMHVEMGKVELSEKIKGLMAAGGDLSEMPLPNLCSKLYSPNLDRLPLEHYLLLKLASSFGERFDLKTLMAINPFKGNLLTQTRIVNALDSVKEGGLIGIAEQRQDKNLVYQFLIPFLNDLLFQRLPFSLRASLKKQINDITGLTLKNSNSGLQSNGSIIKTEEGEQESVNRKLENKPLVFSERVTRRVETVEEIRGKISESTAMNKDLVLKAELLEKKAVRTPNKWNLRYFALSPDGLKWYLNEDEFKRNPKSPIGVIQLEHLYKMRVAKHEDAQKPFGVYLECGNWRKREQMYVGRSIFLGCKDVNQAEDWYVWIEAARTRVLLGDFWGNFENKSKSLSQASIPIQRTESFQETTTTITKPRNQPSGTGAGTGAFSRTPQSDVILMEEEDPADVMRDRKQTADFGGTSHISSEKRSLSQISPNVDHAVSEKYTGPTTTAGRGKQDTSERDRRVAGGETLRRPTNIKSKNRMIAEDFLCKVQATFWSHLFTSPSKLQLTKVYQLDGSHETPKSKENSRAYLPRQTTPNFSTASSFGTTPTTRKASPPTRDTESFPEKNQPIQKTPAKVVTYSDWNTPKYTPTTAATTTEKRSVIPDSYIVHKPFEFDESPQPTRQPQKVSSGKGRTGPTTYEVDDDDWAYDRGYDRPIEPRGLGDEEDLNYTSPSKEKPESRARKVQGQHTPDYGWRPTPQYREQPTPEYRERPTPDRYYYDRYEPPYSMQPRRHPDVEIEYPYDRYTQSVDQEFDDANIEPIEEEESVPRINRRSSNGQLIDDYDRQRIVKKNTISQDGDYFDLKKGDQVVITRVYERRRLVECLWQGLMGLFPIEDIAMVRNSRSVQDEQQNFLVYNQSARTRNAQGESPEEVRKAQNSQRNAQNQEYSQRNAARSAQYDEEQNLNASPHRQYKDTPVRSQFLFAEPTKIPTSILKRQLRDNSYSGADLDTKPSANESPNDSRRMYGL